MSETCKALASASSSGRPQELGLTSTQMCFSSKQDFLSCEEKAQRKAEREREREFNRGFEVVTERG
jgi:hypothetical protein